MKRPLLSLNVRLSKQMLVVYCPPLQQIFQTEALSLHDLVYIVFVASSMVALDTARKLLFPDRQQEMSVSERYRTAHKNFVMSIGPASTCLAQHLTMAFNLFGSRCSFAAGVVWLEAHEWHHSQHGPRQAQYGMILHMPVRKLWFPISYTWRRGIQ